MLKRSFDDPRFWRVKPGRALGVFELGTPFLEVAKIFSDEGIRFEDEDDNAYYLPDLDISLHFSPIDSQPLMLIEIEDQRVRFGTLKVLGDYPHNVLDTLQIPEVETVWCNSLLAVISPDFYRDNEIKKSDHELLSNGTIWITTLGIGMGLSDGEIETLFLCDPNHSPASHLGGFRAEHRELSERLQLKSFKNRARRSNPNQKITSSILFLVFLLVVSFFGYKSWELEQKWNNATEVDGTVAAVSPPPPEPFPEEYTVVYPDANDRLHQIVLRANDIYATSKIGETIKIRYLPDSPEAALGPAKIHDLGFNHFVPYLLWCIGIFLSLHFVSDLLLSRILRSTSLKK